MKIAIDGPAGAGKSATAKALAKKLGFIYVDTVRFIAESAFTSSEKAQKLPQ